jgi:hypothetical protein
MQLKTNIAKPYFFTAILGRMSTVAVNQNALQQGISVHTLPWSLIEGDAVSGIESANLYKYD